MSLAPFCCYGNPNTKSFQQRSGIINACNPYSFIKTPKLKLRKAEFTKIVGGVEASIRSVWKDWQNIRVKSYRQCNHAVGILSVTKAWLRQQVCGIFG